MYAKVFTQIFDSTIADDYEVRHVFSDLLLLADISGVVNMTPAAVARRTNVPIAIIMRAIDVLESPDPQSRTPDHEGRRILRLDGREWGWQIVNYLKYRAIASEEQRRETQRERTRRFREAGGGKYTKWPATRARVLRRDGRICQYCGGRASAVDHIMPLSKGGSGDDDNLAAACSDCNNRKNNRTPQEAGMTLAIHRVTPCNESSPCNATQTQTERQTDHSPKPPKGEGEDCIGPFQRFWEVYPKQKRKMQAERSFHEAGAKEHIDAIVADVRRRKDDRYDTQWQRDDGRWVPMPAAYLDERMWEDAK